MLKQSVHLLRNFKKSFGRTFLVRRGSIFACEMASWLSEKWHRKCFLFRSCFRNKSPRACSTFIVAVFLCFFRHFRNVLVQSIYDHNPWMRSIAKKEFDSDLNPVTALVITDCYRSSCFHGSILSLWIIGHLEVMCTLDMIHPILPVSHRLGSRNTVLQQQSSWYLHRSTHSLFNRRSSERFANFRSNFRSKSLTPAHWSEVVCSLSTNLLVPPWSLICPQQHVSLYFLSSQKSSRPVRRTYPPLLPRHWADWRKLSCITAEVYRQFSTSLCFAKILVRKHWIHGIRDVRFHWSWSSCPQRHDPIHRPAATVLEFAIHNSLFPFSHQTISLYIDMKMIRPINCSGSHCISVIIFWVSAGKFVHSNSIGSTGIRSNSRHWDGWIHKPFDFLLPCACGIWFILPRHNTASG